MAPEPVSQSACRRGPLFTCARAAARVALTGALLASAEPESVTGETAAGDNRVHHSVFNSTFLEPEIAERYGISRARNLFVLNVSVLDAQGAAVDSEIGGKFRNLLGQERVLSFKRIQEGDAIYRIASFTADHREKLRFFLTVETPESEYKVGFSATVYHGN